MLGLAILGNRPLVRIDPAEGALRFVVSLGRGLNPLLRRLINDALDPRIDLNGLRSSL